MAVVVGYDVLSLFYSAFDSLFVQMSIAFILGMAGIVFGVALISLRSRLGPVCLFAGILEMVGGLLLLFLNPIGLLVHMLEVLLEIIPLFQVNHEWVKT